MYRSLLAEWVTWWVGSLSSKFAFAKDDDDAVGLMRRESWGCGSKFSENFVEGMDFLCAKDAARHQAVT